MSGRHFSILLLIVVAIFSRLIPHPWNFTAVGSIALFSGALMRPRWVAYLIPVLAFFLSDLILGFHETMLFTYGAILLSAALGHFYLKDAETKVPWLRVAGLSVASSIIFFVVSNFGVWLATPLYAKTWQGLQLCYFMALPFLQNSLVGDLVYAGLMFWVYQQLVNSSRVPVEVTRSSK